MSLAVTLLPDSFTIYRYAPGAVLPDAMYASRFLSLTSTSDETSVVVADDVSLVAERSEGGWRGFRVNGPLEFSMVGIIARISTALAGAGISLFAISTFDSDYVLVKHEDAERASDALRAVGIGVAP